MLKRDNNNNNNKNYLQSSIVHKGMRDSIKFRVSCGQNFSSFKKKSKNAR